MARPIRSITGSAAAVATALTLVVPATGASAARAASDREFFAVLHGSSAFPTARGWSEYDRSFAKKEVKVVLNNAPDRVRRQWVTVYVSRARTGRMWVNRFGHARLERDTEHGQFVPWAGSGSPVRVRTGGGSLVIWGFYHPKTGD